MFGSMLYMGDKLRYWEGKARLPVQENPIEVFVDGGKEDSLERQHLFFQTVCKEWLVLRESLIGKLAQTYAEVTRRSLSRPFWEDFRLDSITILDGVLDTAEWRISLSAGSDLEHTYWVEMRCRAPEIVSWDS